MIIRGKSTSQLTFEDLRGLRAEGYIRDSTLDQRDGFGPEIQRHNEERFAGTYGLVLGIRWYTEFVSGRHVQKRKEFQQLIEDSSLDQFDVLLVDHTSRFGRNQAECIRYKEELQQLEKVVVFVSQGIISGSDRDFLNERINETLDEQFSRNLSRYVSSGLAEKVNHGLAVGPPPLGYKSEILPRRKGERKVVNSETKAALEILLRDYGTGSYSYRDVADRLNANGYRTRSGRPFTGASVRDVLSNRFYEGKVVYHQGLTDEMVVDGTHAVPREIKDLWIRCQKIKSQRRSTAAGRPRGPNRHFPFSRVLTCHRCGDPYYGEAVRKGEQIDFRLSHDRRGSHRDCNPKPRSQSVSALVNQLGKRVLPDLQLDATWKSRIIAALGNQGPKDQDRGQQDRLGRAIESLRKQHLRGDISDENYRRERGALERQLKLLARPAQITELPNLERAARLLEDLPSLWQHPGVTHEQREALVQEIFRNITIDGKDFVTIEPNPAYVPIFAAVVTWQKLGYCALKPPPSPPTRQS